MNRAVMRRALSNPRRWFLRLLLSTGAALVLFLGADAIWPLDRQALLPPGARVVRDREERPLRFFLPADETWRLPARLSDMTPELREAVVALEDRWFRSHPGINPLAVVRAAWQNVRAGRVVSGASTLPMQLARMSAPSSRSFGAKCREAFRALQIDWHFSKDEILEMYLNRAPYGGNIEGVRAAAWFHFGKEPDRLSAGEVALLAVLPRSPVRYDPAVDAREARAARDRALAQLERWHVITPAEAAAGSRQPLPERRRRAPFAAPHFSQLAADLESRAQDLRTTLDARLQSIAESKTAAAALSLRRQGIDSAAVVVLDIRGSEVRALVGSPAFADTAFQGQVNGAMARRSPGSALKPFLYAMALDEGWLVPDSWLLDVPTDYGGYVAENYDGRFNGLVTVREALVQSLNTPAVRLLARAGVEPFVALLRKGGLRTLDRRAADYGLPLILGGGEVTLLDLTNLYATLARRGLHVPWQVVEGGARTPIHLFSGGAAALTTEMLTGLKRPDLPEAWNLTRDVPQVSWKTGTSYGHRDAWAFGFSERHAIGVWVGNPDGRAHRGLSGAEHAAPLLFDLFRAIEGAGGVPAPTAEAEITERLVCVLSRDLPGPYCPGRMKIPAIAGRSRFERCTRHERVLVDARTGLVLTQDCAAEHAVEARTLVRHPPELVAWWRLQGIPVPARPAVSPDCAGLPSTDEPRIVSPGPGSVYHMRADAPREFQRIPLTVQAGQGVETVYWFLDGALLSRAGPRETVFLRPTRGRHEIAVVDLHGGTDRVHVTVN